MSRQRSLVINPRLIWLSLAAIAGFFVIMSVSLTAAKHWLWGDDPYGVVHLFQLKDEANLPTFFSGLLLAVNATLLTAVCWVRREDGWRRCVWMFLALLFLFLSFDELFEVHEALIKPLRHAWHLSGLLYFGWVLAYVPALLILSIVFFPIWLRLKPIHRLRFAASAIIYVLGAVGFEMLGGARYEAQGGGGDVVYGLIYTIEETLEMAGLIVFLASLLYLLADEVSEVNVSFRLSPSTIGFGPHKA